MRQTVRARPSSTTLCPEREATRMRARSAVHLMRHRRHTLNAGARRPRRRDQHHSWSDQEGWVHRKLSDSNVSWEKRCFNLPGTFTNVRGAVCRLQLLIVVIECVQLTAMSLVPGSPLAAPDALPRPIVWFLRQFVRLGDGDTSRTYQL